jgi:hypothetical protein
VIRFPSLDQVGVVDNNDKSYPAEEKHIFKYLTLFCMVQPHAENLIRQRLFENILFNSLIGSYKATEPLEENTPFPSIYRNMLIETTTLDHKIRFAL